MKPIAIFYHCYLRAGDKKPFSRRQSAVVAEQMAALRQSGLLESATHFLAGINGNSSDAEHFMGILGCDPSIHLNGFGCRTENLTLACLQSWVREHNHGWDVLYFHAKGSSRDGDTGYYDHWRHRLMVHLVKNWRQCVSDLEGKCDAAGCHWLTPEANPGKVRLPYFAGNFWWASSRFLATVPPIETQPEIRKFGPGDPRSRYCAEVFLGTAPCRPKIKDYHPGWP